MTAKHRTDWAHNDPVDKISNYDMTLLPMPAEMLVAATRYVHQRATGPADEADLLDALGLTPTT